MAHALGYVSQNETGNFEGTLTLGQKSTITIVANDNKEGDSQPDFRVYSNQNGEIGAGWNRVGKTSGKPYVSLTLAHPTLCPRKVYVNLGQIKGKENKGTFALLWNPED